ncbi:hypothetical protein BJG93_35055 [Paraburkholderia sprentiae WSM5005]|uniref:Uncharacterized protein n=1 Tax=Paraburkholderia sprentiae WSM5005 TaxID=754502 RepID=A0A8F4QI44_9BURK|nr:hypothetical protein [Paraburkholderia sprentiae]QXE07172.1 hypothetical protein BJG93_35055 [Paraburkholderia sprentiae WSM5005]
MIAHKNKTPRKPSILRGVRHHFWRSANEKRRKDRQPLRRFNALPLR